MRRRRAASDSGTVLIIASLSMVAVLVVVAIVLDLGYLRGGATLDQSTADFAALSGGGSLGTGEYQKACQQMVASVNLNTPSSVSFNASTFCTSMGTTTCSGGLLAQATPAATSGKFTLSIRFPVPNAEISDPDFGAGLHDATPCQRMRVVLTSVEPSFFGGVVGTSSYTTTRTATVVPAKGTEGRRPPALWVLEPRQCQSLETDGSGTTIRVGSATIPEKRGVIQVESDGTGSGCSASKTTIESTGLIEALPTSGSPVGRGEIRLVALPSGATVCSGTACKQSQVGSSIAPAPVPAGLPATRAPVDWKWNCKAGYPTYLGVTIKNCPDPSAPRIDQLIAAIGPSGQPAGFQRWTAARSCNASGTITVTGNWWVDCPGGLTVSTGDNVTFANGNVVFDGGIKMTGSGRVAINTANSNTSPVTSSCAIPCPAAESAAFAYVRSGNIDIKGDFVLHHTMLYLGTSSALKLTGGAQPNWSGPVDGPFGGLALWGEAATDFSMSGGSGVFMQGTFFTPYADPMTITGGGNWGQQEAQFISRRLRLTGGSVISMTPGASSVSLPPVSGVLIR